MEGWNPNLDVGHPGMDAEHRGLHALTLQAAGCLERDDVGGVTGVLSAVFTTFERHFLGEELGFLGLLAVLGLYAALVWRGLRAERRAGTVYGFFLALGLSQLWRAALGIP